MTKTDPAARTKQVILYRVLAVAVPTIFLVIAGIFTQLSSQQLTKLRATQQEILVAKQSVEEAVNFNSFLTTHQIDLEKMGTAMPSESMLVGVVQDIEAIIRAYDPRASLTFSQATPVRIGTDLVVPLSITLNISLDQLPRLYEQLMTLPYLLQVTQSESKISDNITTTTITMRLYVQDPFIGY